jgi:ATP-dependent protease Clp ATPase subunit
MKSSDSSEVLRCSFCHKSKDVVRKLIASPADRPRSYICDKCVAVCNSILADDEPMQPYSAVRSRRVAFGLKQAIRKIFGHKRVEATPLQTGTLGAP